jgi:hypothetical protein
VMRSPRTWGVRRHRTADLLSTGRLRTGHSALLDPLGRKHRIVSPRPRRAFLNESVAVEHELATHGAFARPVRPQAVLRSVDIVTMHAAHLALAPVHRVRPIEGSIWVLAPHLAEAVELLVAPNYSDVTDATSRQPGRGSAELPICGLNDGSGRLAVTTGDVVPGVAVLVVRG